MLELELLKQQAGQGDPNTQYFLATLYKSGRGVEKNLKKSIY